VLKGKVARKEVVQIVSRIMICSACAVFPFFVYNFELRVEILVTGILLEVFVKNFNSLLTSAPVFGEKKR
jgi:hypothetical protein